MRAFSKIRSRLTRAALATSLLVVASSAAGASAISAAGAIDTPAGMPMVQVSAADDLELCLERADSFVLGDVGAASIPPERWRDAALRDLAAIVAKLNAEDLAAAYPVVAGDGLAAAVEIIPASNSPERVELFDRARESLIEEYRPLVSAEDIRVGEPVGYSFAEICQTYLKLDQLMAQDAEQFIDALQLVMSDAKIRFSAVAPMRAEIERAISGGERFVQPSLIESFPKRELTHRVNDVNGFNAGNGLQIDLVGTTDTGLCSSGFVLRNTANTARYMLTAGHCNGGYNDNAKVYNGTLGICPSAYSGMGTVGHIGSNLLLHPVKTDTAIIYPSAGASHTPKMWAGSACIGDGEADIVGVQPPWGGLVVGYSGHISGQIDTTVSSTGSGCYNLDGYQICQLWTATSWYSPNEDGDSGGPVFAYNGASSVWAVGTIVGRTEIRDEYNNIAWLSYFTPVTVSSYQYGSPVALP